MPIGGHNLLEASLLGKPVLFGPFMDDFKEEKKLLESFGGGICVPDKDTLADKAFDLLSQPDKADRLGGLAKQAVLSATVISSPP